MYDLIFVQPWPWWAGGAAIGFFCIAYSFVLNRLIGMSSAIEYSINEWRRPWIEKRGMSVDLSAAALAFAKDKGLDLTELGLPSVTVSTKPASEPIEYHPRMMVVGVIIGAFLGGFLEHREWFFSLGPSFDAFLPLAMPLQALILLVGGLMVGFGARMAGGCPSGHGLGGLSMLSPSSFVAVAGYFVTGIGLTYLIGRLAS